VVSRDRRFMVDDGLLDDIVGYAQLTEGDVVLEVGAGSGNLTGKLADVVKLSAVEKDADLYRMLARRFGGDDRVELIRGDALKVEYPMYNKIVSNIPYSITRKLTERFILEGFELAVLLVQKEFAQKLTAQPTADNYRMITVLVQSTCGVEVIQEIPPRAFRPQPKVASAVVRLRQRWRPPLDYPVFLKKLFSCKSKKIRNILEAPGEYGQLRPKEMTPEQILGLYRSV
jgi:16S rRNA (adenine1518-N6/adenine1519-N6)-dimethyltransferase